MRWNCPCRGARRICARHCRPRPVRSTGNLVVAAGGGEWTAEPCVPPGDTSEGWHLARTRHARRRTSEPSRSRPEKPSGSPDTSSASPGSVQPTGALPDGLQFVLGVPGRCGTTCRSTRSWGSFSASGIGGPPRTHRGLQGLRFRRGSTGRQESVHPLGHLRGVTPSRSSRSMGSLDGLEFVFVLTV